MTLEQQELIKKMQEASVKAFSKEPAVVTEKEVVPTSYTPKSESDQIRIKLGEILKEHNNTVGNIPLTHEYWSLLNQFRVLNNK